MERAFMSWVQSAHAGKPRPRASLDPTAWLVVCASLSVLATRQSGACHATYVQRFSESVDHALELVAPENRARAIEVAMRWNYSSASVVLQKEQQQAPREQASLAITRSGQFLDQDHVSRHVLAHSSVK